MANEDFDFDKKAASWDENPARVGLASDIAGALLGENILASGMELLEYGCGTGLLTLRLSPVVKSVTGVDTSRGMLSVLEGKIKSKGLANISTRLLDPAAGELLEGSYDAVVSSMTLHHVKEIAPLAARFYKVTKPGGHIFLADLDPDEGQFHGENPTVFHDGIDRAWLKEILTDAGFGQVRDKTAAMVERPLAEGGLRRFSIFLISGVKG